MALSRDGAGFDVSVIIPLLNEQENVQPLYRELNEVLGGTTLNYELIFIDDGSHDQTFARLHSATMDDPRVSIIQFTKRFGQTAAMAAGFRLARGAVVVPMDGDCQNDPRDIPRLLSKLDEPPGWDIVSGWRVNRHDRLMSRRLPSKLANALIRRLTWTSEVHDFGCTMKAYRAQVLEDVRLYGEMHRFLPAICKWRGARITEMPVNHRPRTAGQSKYGLKRTIKVLLDLLTVKFLGDYLTKPIYFFGKLALGAMLLGIVAVLFAIVQKVGYLTEHGTPVMLNDNVLVLLGMLMVILAVLFLMMGMLSELLVRIYHESQGLFPYKVRHVIHASESADPDAADAGADGRDAPSRRGEDLPANPR